MTVSKPRLVSTGAALRHAQSHGVKRSDIANVTIDGAMVEPETALAALAALEKENAEAVVRSQKARKPPGAFARASRGVMDSFRSASAWMKETFIQPSGRWLKDTAPMVDKAAKAATGAINQITMTRPEDLDRLATVRIITRRGPPIDIPVLVRDEFATKLLARTSAAASGAGWIPAVGNLVQGGTGLVALLASGASYSFGDKELGNAFLGMGKKHVVMGLIAFVPVVSLATAPAALEDMKLWNGSGVRVDEIVQLERVAPGGP